MPKAEIKMGSPCVQFGPAPVDTKWGEIVRLGAQFHPIFLNYQASYSLVIIIRGLFSKLSYLGRKRSIL